MFEEHIANSMRLLENNGIFLTEGMTEQEIEKAERCYNITFPTDYRAFLSICLPLYDYDYTDWRNTSDKYVSHIKCKMYDETIDGVLYTITRLGGWPDAWGIRPPSDDEAIALAKNQIRQTPLFIPINSNRYLSLSPHQSGNSVYSIHQGDDVICYGKDIWDYFSLRYGDDNERHVNLKEASEPVPQYNTFVYHSINNFFYQGNRYFDESGMPINREAA
ncbi:SMI1/KNR4 family protein [Leminorella grimontii]|uniref:SMI1/KNR4 family protein n=1 Tax=Leminorella grimontii TaxID=82981 RepID=UPI003220903B